MSASEHISGQFNSPYTQRKNVPLFHGTNKKLNRGDVILPADNFPSTPSTIAADDGPDYYKDGHHQVAHASEKAVMAGFYANRAVEHLGGNFHLYRVEPVNPQDVKHEFEDEFSSPSGFRVKRRLNIDNTDDDRLTLQWNQVMARSSEGESKKSHMNKVKSISEELKRGKK